MSNGVLIFWLSVVSAACWPICFWWMWRISRGQNIMLRQLRDQTRRIEQVATAEHDILKDAHPQIGEIRDAVEQLAAKK